MWYFGASRYPLDAIASDDTLELTYATLQDNFAQGSGGAIRSAAKLRLDSCRFFSNRSVTRGGAIYHSQDTLRISRSEFVRDSSKRSGAIMALAPLLLSSSRFVHNASTDSAGAVFSAKHTIVDSCTFDSNAVEGSYPGIPLGFAGALYAAGDSLMVNASRFSYNHAGNGGGAIMQYALFSRIADSRFIRNHSATNGGALFNGGGICTVRIERSEITYNTADDFSHMGGGIYNGCAMELISSTVAYNQSKANGGGIGSDGFLRVISSTIVGNRSLNNSMGGGVCSTDSLLLLNSLVAYNRKGDVYPSGQIVHHKDPKTVSSQIADSLPGTFAFYTTDTLGGLSPILADNGGFSWTVALSEGGSASGVGVRVGRIGDDGPFVYYSNGSWLDAFADTLVDERYVLEIQNDQRGVKLGSLPSQGAYHFVPTDPLPVDPPTRSLVANLPDRLNGTAFAYITDVAGRMRWTGYVHVQNGLPVLPKLGAGPWLVKLVESNGSKTVDYH